MATVARIQKDGTFLSPPEINERLPVVTSGLIAHYPLDSKAGAFDVIGGRGSIQNAESGVNLLEAMNSNWRNPSNWSSPSGVTWDEKYQALKIVDYHNMWLVTPIVVDTTKHYQVSMTVMEEVQSNTGLYLGGYCENVLGERVTGNFDYSYAVNAQPTTGVWTTYRITRFGTGNIISSTSTSFTNVSGWMGDRTDITDKLTYKYYYGGLFNYSGGGIMYIKDCSIVAVDADTSNTVGTIDGLAIQQATTNIIPSPDRIPNGWGSYNNGHDGSCFTELGSQGVQLINKQSWCGCWIDITLPSTGTYTLSVWVKLIGRTSTSISVNLYTSGGGISDVAVSADWALQGRWQRISMKNTYTSTSIRLYLICYGGVSDPAYKVSCIYTQPQIEASLFINTYVVGAKSASALTFPFVFSNNMTFAFEHFPSMPTTEQVGQSTSPNIFELGSYYTNASVTFWCWGGAIRTYFRGDASPSWQTVPTHTTLSNTNWLQNHKWVLVFSGTSGWTSYKVYLDGVQIGTTETLSPAITTISGSFFGFGNFGGACPNAVYKNLSVYNRVLSDDEIKQLSGQSFKVTASRATIKSLVESPVIPLDAYYYPLSSNAKNYEGQVDAYTSTNLAYENSSVWVGTATTNYFNNPTDFSTSSWTASASKLTPNLLGFTNQQYMYQSITGALSTVHTISWKLRGVVTDQTIRTSCENATVGNGYPLVTLKKYPKTFSQQITTTASGLASPMLYQFTGDNSNLSQLYILHAQAEAKPFPTPFVTGTRGASNLSYNFNSSIGLDWSGNWSICYWKKPVATYADNFYGYNIESLGCNSNSVGGGYMWFGKTNGSDAVGWNSYDTITPANYFNQWQFVSIVKTGTSCTITWKLNDGQIVTKTGTISTAVANYFVTPHGYDFKLGGWDNGNPTNTYFSDLVVVKRALTTAELTLLYTQLSAKKTKVNARNVIENGI